MFRVEDWEVHVVGSQGDLGRHPGCCGCHAKMLTMHANQDQGTGSLPRTEKV